MSTNNETLFTKSFKTTGDKGASFRKLEINDNKFDLKNPVKVTNYEKYTQENPKAFYDPNTRLVGNPSDIANYLIAKLDELTPPEERGDLIDTMARFITENSIHRDFRDDDHFELYMTDKFIHSPSLQRDFLNNIKSARGLSGKRLIDAVLKGIPSTSETIAFFHESEEKNNKKKELDLDFIINFPSLAKEHVENESRIAKENGTSSPKRRSPSSKTPAPKTAKAPTELTDDAKRLKLAKDFLEKYNKHFSDGKGIYLDYVDGKKVGKYIDTSTFDAHSLTGILTKDVSDNVVFNTDSTLTSSEERLLKGLKPVDLTENMDKSTKHALGKLIAMHSGYNSGKSGEKKDEKLREAVENNISFVDLVNRLFDLNMHHPSPIEKKTVQAEPKKTYGRVASPTRSSSPFNSNRNSRTPSTSNRRTGI